MACLVNYSGSDSDENEDSDRKSPYIESRTRESKQLLDPTDCSLEVSVSEGCLITSHEPKSFQSVNIVRDGQGTKTPTKCLNKPCIVNDESESDLSDEPEMIDYLGIDSGDEESENETTFIRGDRIWLKSIPGKSRLPKHQKEFPPKSSADTQDLERRSQKILIIENTDEKKEISELPQSSFWQGKGADINWSNPENIWGYNSNPQNVISHPHVCAAEKSVVHSKKRRTEGNAVYQIEQPSQLLNPLQKTCFFVHHKVSSSLHQNIRCEPARRMVIQLEGHAGAVNRIKWCKSEYSHLLASVSMDTSVKIWNVFSKVNHCVQTFRTHLKAVRDVAWSPAGSELLSCGYDKTARLHDVIKGSEVSKFEHHDFLTCIKYHPVNPNYILSGSRDRVLCWDIRTCESPVKIFDFRNNYGLVQDLTFLRDGTEFAISTDIVSRDAADRNIIVYDFTSGVVLSNQVYQERYTCPRLCEHPQKSEFMAQTNGDYVALFSTIKPYKMNKCRRFDKHKVLGYAVGCGYSPDGRFVVSGGSDGNVTIYDYQRAVVLQRLGEQGEIYLDVAWHPVLSSTLASSTWSGKISLWQ